MSEHRERYAALVTSLDDPEQRGRIKVKSQEILAEDVELPDWLDPCFPFTGGNDAGWFFLPDIGDIVEIEAVVGSSDDDHPGTAFHAYPRMKWRCCAYSDTDDVPSEMRADGKYTKRMGLKDRAGQVLVFDSDVTEMFLRFGKLRLGSATSNQPLVLGNVLKAMLSSFLALAAAHAHVADPGGATLVGAVQAHTHSVTVPPGGGTVTTGPPLNAGSMGVPTTAAPGNAAAILALKTSPVDNGLINSDIAFSEKGPAL